ncbi:MAG: ATP synthase F1 subunit gamma, partial [Candidatus Methylomirabilis sp.]|nr:ATP synthase F1 subunit gamma [Deltaproteobacteria bacterium]
QQITKAMKMVAAAKLRKSQDAITRTRPYAQRLQGMLGSVSTRVGAEMHPLFEDRGTNRVELLVFSSDRGLCGGFNSNLFRAVDRWRIRNSDKEITLNLVGRKANDYFKRRGVAIRKTTVGIPGSVPYSFARRIAEETVEAFRAGEIDRVVIFYNEFVNAISQRVTSRQLLPIAPGAIEKAPQGSLDQEYIFEPPAAEILPTLVPRHVEFQIYAALLDSQASEYGARMSAMDSATRNAGEAIDRLTLYANRVRQAAITRELVEITTGAEALKG